MRWLARWWPALLWAGAIFAFSTGAFSAANTGRVVLPILHWLFPGTPQATLTAMHFFLRKTGHVTEYFVLSLLVLRGISGGRHEVRWRWAAIAVAIVALYATSDEFHQSLVPGRGGLELSDVLLDTAAGATAQAVAAIAVKSKQSRAKK
jgi:VanZ family protein